MRILVSSLLNSLPSLFNVVLLMLFMFAVFGILGLQLLYVLPLSCASTCLYATVGCVACSSGSQHHRCRLTEFPIRFAGSDGISVCNIPHSDVCAATLALADVSPMTGAAKSVWSQKVCVVLYPQFACAGATFVLTVS
jgi:hypothetical protein